MNMITSPFAGPHTHAQRTTGQIMGLVMLALAPATLFGFYLFGWPAVNLWVITILAALGSEAISLRLANKPVLFYLSDGSALLSAWLLALTLPPWAPWWIGVVGGVMAIILGKQVFGGIGQNLFNPAMLARVVLLISFPVEMTSWVLPQPMFSAHTPGFLEALNITFNGYPLDMVSGASSLGAVRTELTQGHSLSMILVPHHYTSGNLALGFISGSLGETSAVLIILGGLFLLYKRIFTWHVPVSMLASVAVLATLFHFINPERYADAGFHLFSGGMILGAFFIATDPVTSPNSTLGKLIFGAGLGGLDYVIRTWGGYPEGIAFSVMLMNAMTPLIDHYTRPRVYGHTWRGATREYSEDELNVAHKSRDNA
ncbi:MAG: RnfABCDGE type electron transport complex subunit D [Gammaproteobacteria bacterium]|nr:RnfABCDGE type electron transport complex subunit D [Gammaproteobacteria bacterium]